MTAISTLQRESQSLDERQIRLQRKSLNLKMSSP
jgi:hypothetical protein